MKESTKYTALELGHLRHRSEDLLYFCKNITPNDERYDVLNITYHAKKLIKLIRALFEI